ncbi:hypothetical protein DTO164E3_3789 [Paecilomyces variotii]|nr:hypothetical protein DTO164E3_3789 [Paecilomyces variotii]KAJ9206101.1 hypothetical protein DTO032I3_1966 [Paecilomyces variotii]KAJ9281696.1 hypothetical protein DTO021D3_1462 [Paecilomyces variotii]KAJ9345958.1 hypothetical protein DTO027B6_1372 [Paecilomyces variotii]KAJ9392337.1 hypothetical protein DTO032I4_751 [Paecilomyces variotii]
MIPHRTISLVAIVVFFAFLLLIFSSTPISDQSSSPVFGPAKYVPHPKLPSLSNIRFPFRPAAHRPPEQKNSTSGESSWFSDWSWLNPFSSSITLDENRSVLPPLRERPPVYTYYDNNGQNDKDEQAADSKLLLAWRRAWFAQGFRPVVLSRGEAMNNQLYEAVQRLKLDPQLEAHFFSWLAWSHMGTGILADWRCFPMAKYDDELLSYLRRGAVPTHITRFENLDSGLFAGEKTRIDEALKEAIKNANDHAKSITEIIPPDFFKVEQPSALAFYDSATITSHYPTLAEKHVDSSAAGRLALTELINSHLHNTFQNTFVSGIAVLKPFPEHTTALVEPVLLLAKALIQCPPSTLPTSCPPNRPKCVPCASAKAMPITQPSVFKNTSEIFTIGAVPHPYTLISLLKGSDDISTRYIRRETQRDQWLKEVTLDLLGTERGGPSRVVTFKEAVAGDAAVPRSLWMTVESLPAKAGEGLSPSLLDEMEWQFGFAIPRNTQAGEKKEKEKETRETKETKDGKGAVGAKEGVDREYILLDKAREVLRSKDTNRIGVRDVAEAWNLADTEAWRFVRAYRARSVVERKKWEEEEKNFVGARMEE